MLLTAMWSIVAVLLVGRFGFVPVLVGGLVVVLVQIQRQRGLALRLTNRSRSPL